MSRRSRLALMAWRISMLLLLFTPVDAKKRRNKAGGHGGNHVQTRKRECENECAPIHEDERPNCVLKCQSDACYTEVYMPEELEPGEIDNARQRAFQNCITRESREQRLNAHKQKGQPQAEPNEAEADQEAPTTEDAAVEL